DSSRRSIPLSEQQAEFLKQYKENQKPKTNIVVANSQGNFMMKRNVRRAMKRICERAGVKEITFHELRHTHATLMLEMNEHIKIVQQRLGHVKAETTVNIYSHVRPQVHHDSAQRFSNFFEAQYADSENRTRIAALPWRCSTIKLYRRIKSRHCFVTGNRKQKINKCCRS